MESNPERYEITGLTEVRIGNEVRWKGKANFPDSPRGKSMIIFQIKGELIAVPSKCPHEGYTLDNAHFVSDCEVECIAHQNVYSLLPGGLPTYKVIEDGETIYAVRHNYY
ncbi:MAG: Rieske 2Fe-2S domain-containing protein, partial [Leptospiraceae bacterium]|nr:Rieske 2Fe-2S domain-containing protein [Leptospiraceae bacterium]